MKIPKVSKSINPYVQRAGEFERILDETEISKIPRAKPVFLEIGCSHGAMLRNVALHHPEHCFVGNDYKFKEVVLTAERCEKLPVWVVKSRVQDFIQNVGDDFFSGLFCFYPDPWKKARHLKHRIWQPAFVKNLIPKMQEASFIMLKTDQEDYYEQMVEVLSAFREIKILGFGHYLKDTEAYDPLFASYFEDLFFAQGLRPFYVFAQVQKNF